MADKERNYSKDEIFQTYNNYLHEANTFNSYLREVVAHTSRWTRFFVVFNISTKLIIVEVCT